MILEMEKEKMSGTRFLRKGRMFMPGATYFVSSFKSKSAADIDNTLCFQAILQELEQLEGEGVFTMLAIVVMPDHFHLLLRMGNVLNLSQAIRRLKGATGRRINQLRSETGSLWYKGFHEHLVRSQETLRGYLGYIRSNPVRKGLVQSPEQWPFIRIRETALTEPKPK